MTSNRLSFLIVAMLLFGMAKSQAQVLQEIFSDSTLVALDMLYINDDTFLVEEATYQHIGIYKIRDDGTLIDTLIWHTQVDKAELCWTGKLQRFPNGRFGLFYVQVQDSLAQLKSITFDESLNPTTKSYWPKLADWYIDNIDPAHENNTHAILNKDGSVFFSYLPDSLYFGTDQFGHQTKAIRFLKYDSEGAMVAERLFTDSPMAGWWEYSIFPTSDSLGCSFVTVRPNNQFYYFSGYTMNANLDIVLSRFNIYNLTHPLFPESRYFATNPFNGKIYSISPMFMPEWQGAPAVNREIVMTVFDENFTQTNYVWGAEGHENCQVANFKSIDISPDGTVFMLSRLGYVGGYYLGWVDENGNKLGEIYLEGGQLLYEPISVSCCPSGGCIFSVYFYDTETHEKKGIIYKLTDPLDVDEAHEAGFAVATAYPNPGKDVLNIRTALQNASVEVFDMNGRLIHRQAITENVTAIDATDWVSGVYVWKAYASDGGPSTGSGTSGSTTLRETGKWVKE